jgi:hypothetical protein
MTRVVAVQSTCQAIHYLPDNFLNSRYQRAFASGQSIIGSLAYDHVGNWEKRNGWTYIFARLFQKPCQDIKWLIRVMHYHVIFWR